MLSLHQFNPILYGLYSIILFHIPNQLLAAIMVFFTFSTIDNKSSVYSENFECGFYPIFMLMLRFGCIFMFICLYYVLREDT